MTTAPEPVDLTALRDRAQTYVLGLEAKVAQLNAANDSLRQALADDIERRVVDRLEAEYARGWDDAAAQLASKAAKAIDALVETKTAAVSQYVATRKDH